VIHSLSLLFNATFSPIRAPQVVDYTRVSKKEANSKMYVPSVTHSQFLQHPLGKPNFAVHAVLPRTS
jgi:hypothetical protein